jgi:hypothetical protein
MGSNLPDLFAAHFAVHTRHLVDDQNPPCACESCRVCQALKEQYLRRGLFEAFPRLGELLGRILSLPLGAPPRDRAVNEMAVLLSRMRLALPSPRTPPPGRGIPGVRAARGSRRMARRFLAPARRNRLGRRG